MKLRWKYLLTSLLLVYLIIIFFIYSVFFGNLAKLDSNLIKKENNLQNTLLITKQPAVVHSEENVSMHYHQVLQNDATFKAWWHSKHSFCDSTFIGFNNLFALLNNVSLDPAFGSGPPGGEPIESVLNQPEEKEFLVLKPGYFQISCKEADAYKYKFEYNDHLAQWMSVMRPVLPSASNEITHGITVAVTRYEYANLYHTMTDWYNAFLMLLFFNVKKLAAEILFVDGHPQGGLDSTWTTLFGKFVRAGQLKNTQFFKTLIWNIQGYKSPMYHHSLPSIPHIESFRSFFLRKHTISSAKELNCDKLSIAFLWRRDYVAHPRNPKGSISRKVKNEKEIEDSIYSLYVNHSIVSLSTENMTMYDQLSAIVDTDILIGMHGAGLTLALFLPKHAGLIELYPKYWSKDNEHFKAIARWRNLNYSRWQNTKGTHEFPNHFTYIPPSVIQKLLSEIIAQMCTDL